MTTRPYRPSNGTQGEMFCERWCWRCNRESEDALCEILTRTTIFDLDSPDYPTEWIEGPEPFPDSNPRCTAFEPLVEPLDPRQPDLFGSSP